MQRITRITSLAILTTALQSPAAEPPKFEWTRFEVDGHRAFVILPKKRASKSIPWVLYAPTFGDRLPNARDEGCYCAIQLSGAHAVRQHADASARVGSV